MTEDRKSHYKDIADLMGEPKHIHGLEAELADHTLEPFTHGVIKNISVQEDSLTLLLHYAPWEDFIKEYTEINRSATEKPSYEESIHGAINDLFYTNLYNALGNAYGDYILSGDEIGEWISEESGLKFLFSYQDLNPKEKSVQFRISVKEDKDRQGIQVNDFVNAYALHLKKAITE